MAVTDLQVRWLRPWLTWIAMKDVTHRNTPADEILEPFKFSL
jgi:hypothetical protein